MLQRFPMMNRRQFFTLITTTTLLASCGRSTQSNHRIVKGSTVVALGDSLTYGYGASKNAAYPVVLQELTGWNVLNHGISGDTSADVFNRITETIAVNPKMVLLGIGGNDFMRKVDENETRDNIIKTIQQLKNNNIQTVLIAEPHFTVGALLGHFSDHPMYQEIAKQENIPLAADLWSDILSDKSLKSDQIHANDAGYRRFAKKLTQFLQKQGLL